MDWDRLGLKWIEMDWDGLGAIGMDLGLIVMD